MKNNPQRNYCGNCDGHNSYDYPTKIFCSKRHANNQDPIVDTLWHCSDFNRINQKCYCVQEALKMKNGAKEE